MFRVWERSAFKVGALGIVATVVCITPGQAGLDTSVAFDIPAGDLGRTLMAISRQGGVMISFPSDLVAGRRAGALQEKLPVREALARVLGGTNLHLVPGSGGSVTVVANPAISSAAATGLGDIAVIDVTEVGGSSRFGDVGFQAGNAGDTVRVAGAQAKEIPIKVDTVTANVIRSQVITNPLDAAQNISGVVLGGSSPDSPTFTIRGFQTDAVTVNGMGITGYSNTGSAQIPIDDVERVEVLKGPTSILTGATANGGVINVSTKQPTNREIHDVTVRYGTFNYRTLAFDFGGPVKGTEGLTYRFNVAGTQIDQSDAGYRDRYETLISPVVRWEDADTSILAGFRYIDQRKPIGAFTFVNPNLTAPHPIFKLPRGTPYINPDFAYSSRNTTVYSDFSHKFGDILGADTTINNKFSYDVFSDDLNRFTWLRNRFSNAPIGEYNGRQVFGLFDGTRLVNRSDLTLVYDAGFAKQTSTFGLDYQEAGGTSTTNNGPTTRINLFAPSGYRALFRTPSSIKTDYSYRESNQVGYYYLEKFDTLDNRLHILGQVRYDQARFDLWHDQPSRSDVDVSRIEGMSWVAGAAFDVTPYLTVYGNRSNGFVPQLGTQVATGKAAPPQTRDQWEVGGRAFLFDKKLSVTASYSDIAATNVARCDPILGCNFFVIVSGQRSKTFELDVQGELYPGLNIIGSFATVNAKTVTTSNTIVKLDGSPQYTASIWGTYTLQSGLLQGVTFGFGARGNSDSIVYPLSNTGPAITMPGYVALDAMLGYDYEQWSMQLRVRNFLDKYSYVPSYSGNYIGISEGRAFLFQAKYAFN